MALLYQQFMGSTSVASMHASLRGEIDEDLPRPRRRESTLCSTRKISSISTNDDVETNSDNMVFDDHRLQNFNRGESEVEELAARIEDRQRERVTVLNGVRMRFERKCHAMAQQGNHPSHKIPISDLKRMIDQVRREQTQQRKHYRGAEKLMKIFGFRAQSEQLLHLLEKGLSTSEKMGEEYFHWNDFNNYYVKTESRWPWMRSGRSMSFLAMFMFYVFTPVLFCKIMHEPNICQADPTNLNRSYYGWVSSLYFASTTISTVGYGDLHVSQDSNVSLIVGIIFMILSNVMLIVALSTAADSSTSVLTKMNAWILRRIWGDNDSELLSKKIRRVLYLRIGQIVLTFILLNAVGVVASQLILLGSRTQGDGGDETIKSAQNWSWMLSIYWAVQTTTTIGYGDVEMDFNLRWFQILYLILATYFVGNTLRGLNDLKDEIREIISYSAWSRREVSKGLIDELQPYEHDDKIDQYEFVVASLVTLGKVSYSDLVPIMDKFRSLASEDGFIEVPESGEPPTTTSSSSFNRNQMEQIEQVIAEEDESDEGTEEKGPPPEDKEEAPPR